MASDFAMIWAYVGLEFIWRICNGAIRRQAAEREDPVALCATVQGGAEKGDDVFGDAIQPPGRIPRDLLPSPHQL
ncbi:hypothetical protein CMEL01_02786 [Colletotrichum melonis]|uniref:Uncharacterized protein n=1 Tax=Colletotrichum melonis TaxID=1209925 RepID=A0AAI9XQH4_9PEZI|nr:hypothetical protein CMEL01_02786 [Colletotrichum melonis]